jgi:cysteine desulfurase
MFVNSETNIRQKNKLSRKTMTYVSYLDCAATAPIESEVLAVMIHFFEQEFGNSGSRTHQFGARAKRAVEEAREEVARVVHCDPAEVIFTSGATESNNMAILGLASHGVAKNRKHIVSTAIEHKAVLEPLQILEGRGFEITLLHPGPSGRVKAEDIVESVRPDTLLVSVMHANNETGVIQPITQILDGLADSDVIFHTDAAQTFGKELDELQSTRIDLISISGHKIFGPKGIGALITRRRGGRAPLEPLMFGGGQERGLRPGTMPVALAAGLGAAAKLALRDQRKRTTKCIEFRQALLDGLAPLKPRVHGDTKNMLPHIVNLSLADIDSEAVMLALRENVAISNGSACTSATYSPSHVLTAMDMPSSEVETATRWSWSHMTVEPDWAAIRERIEMLM